MVCLEYSKLIAETVREAIIGQESWENNNKKVSVLKEIVKNRM